MGNFSGACVSGPHRAGSYGYAMTADNRPRGRVCRVDYDSKAWFYRVERARLSLSSGGFGTVFPGNNGERYRVTGSFPYYDVEIVR
jgi:hypothetical protein